MCRKSADRNASDLGILKDRSQQDVIEYLQEENRVLREQLAGKRLRFTNEQRRKIEPASWRRREWARILKRAGLDTGEVSHTPKDLRDTFASQLLTVGGLERIKKYLGHATLGVTEKHYATWVHEEETEGFRLQEGEVRPDFLARLIDCPPDRPPVQNSVS